MTSVLPRHAAPRCTAKDHVADPPQHPDAVAPNPAIRLRGVTKTFDRILAIVDVSLAVPAGSTVAVVGANGAGKSTLLTLIAGLAAPTSGTVTIHGRPVDCGREDSPLLGVLTHQTMVYDRLTGRENLELHARLRGVAPDRVAAVLEEVELTAAAERPAGTYSHGMRKRLALARTLLHDPAVLLLDEPFAGLDPDAQLRLSQLLGRLRGSRTIVFTTHNLDCATAHADRVLHVERGRVHDDFQPQGATASPTTSAGAAGHSAGPTHRPAGLLRTGWIMACKDLTTESRGRTTSTAILLLAGLLAAVLGMAFEPLSANPRAVSGALWLLVVFAALHGLTRSFDEDLSDDALRGVLLTGVDPAGVYLGRVASASLTLLAVALAAAGVVAVLFAAPELFGVLPRLMLVLALAVMGLVSAGAILTVISRHSTLGETLLPLLLLPLAIPVLLGGIESVAVLLETGALDGGWLRVLVAYAVGMLAASTIVFEHTVKG